MLPGQCLGYFSVAIKVKALRFAHYEFREFWRLKGHLQISSYWPVIDLQCVINSVDSTRRGKTKDGNSWKKYQWDQSHHDWKSSNHMLQHIQLFLRGFFWPPVIQRLLTQKIALNWTSSSVWYSYTMSKGTCHYALLKLYVTSITFPCKRCRSTVTIPEGTSFDAISF